jgi:hypothetical protein
MVDPNEARRFDEKEFALILRRATELQEQGAAPSSRSSLTLREIEAIAAEAGIEPALIRRAALDLSGGPAPSLWRRVAGPAPHIHTEKTIPGELGPDALSAIIDAARTELGPGTARDVLRGVEWSGRDSWGKVHVAARPRGGETRLEVSADRSETAAVAATLLPIAGLILGGVAASALDVSLVVAGGVGLAGGLSGARLVWNAVASRWQTRVRVVLDRVSAAVDNARRDRVGSVD